MAEFTTKCPHCNIELVADEDWIGMELECPSCKQMLTVAKEVPKIFNLSIPQIKPITPTANANDENTETSFTFVCPECGTQVELPIALKGKKYECKTCCEESIAEPATEKKCPHCGKMIKLQAKVCKYCKKDADSVSTSITECENRDLMNIKNLFMWWFCLFCIPFINIVAGVIWFILLYQYWNILPEDKRGGITPGKAIGFLFIPFFGVYWAFFINIKLGKELNSLNGNTNKILTWAPLVMCILSCLVSIPFVNFIAIGPCLFFVALVMLNYQKEVEKFLEKV